MSWSSTGRGPGCCRAGSPTPPDLVELIDTVRSSADDLTWAIDLTDGPATLVIALLLTRGHRLLHVPGITVNRAADTYRGEGKTDAKDAAIIADQARMRRDLRLLRLDDPTIAELQMLTTHRADLAGDRTRAINRLRGRLAAASPALEAALDFTNQGPLVLINQCPTATAIRTTGPDELHRWLRSQHVRSAATLYKYFPDVESILFARHNDHVAHHLGRRRPRDAPAPRRGSSSGTAAANRPGSGRARRRRPRWCGPHRCHPGRTRQLLPARPHRRGHARLAGRRRTTRRCRPSGARPASPTTARAASGVVVTCAEPAVDSPDRRPAPRRRCCLVCSGKPQRAVVSGGHLQRGTSFVLGVQGRLSGACRPTGPGARRPAAPSCSLRCQRRHHRIRHHDLVLPCQAGTSRGPRRLQSSASSQGSRPLFTQPARTWIAPTRHHRSR